MNATRSLAGRNTFRIRISEAVSHDLRLLSTATPEWDVWLSRVPHDFYHTAGYHRLAEACGEGRAFLAVYGDEGRFLAWPYLLRPVSTCAGLEESQHTDVGSVYGYPGPLGPQRR